MPIPALSRGVIGRNNRPTRIVRFMDFREEIENGNINIRDMGEGVALIENTMKRAST